jgi:hypothetical protein
MKSREYLNMHSFRVIGEVDHQHRLTVIVPSSIPPGSVEVVLITRADGDDETGLHWASGISQEWSDELNDPHEDIYTLDDGTPIDGPR